MRRDIPHVPLPAEIQMEVVQPALGYRRAEAGHQVLVVLQIVPGQQHGGEDFARFHKVVQVGAAVALAGRAVAGGVQRAGVVGVAGVAQVDGAAAGEGLGGPP